MMQTNENSKESYSEDDWSDVKACGAYEKSKTLAEKAAWEYLHSLPQEERFELVVINPSLILGPSMVQTDFTSGVVIKKIMGGSFPGMPKIMMPVVDVRDVARAHLLGIKVEEAKNQRFILNCKSLWFQNIAEALNEEYGKWYKIKTGELRYCTLKIACIFDKQARLIAPMWGKKLILANERSVNVLGLKYQDPKKTIVEMAESMIDSGLIQDKRKK